MFQLLAYGSLLSSTELSKLGFDPTTATPVTVHGYRRSFHQEPSWRECATPQRAVLSAERHASSSFNAVLATAVEDSPIESLDHRERGYRRVTVEPSELRLFDNGGTPQTCGEIYLYCGKPCMRNESLLPNPTYLELCLQAARSRGHEFHRAFLRSTFVGEKYLQEFLAIDPDGDSLCDPAS